MTALPLSETLPRVLLIEDNEADVRLLRDAFHQTNDRLVLDVAADAAEALCRLDSRSTAGNELPDLILLDLNLPRMSGLEFLEQVKSRPDLRRIPVVVLTSSDAKSDVYKAYDLHANGYLIKPMGLSELRQMAAIINHFWLDTVTLARR